ncbi:MAG: hypothetical protein KAH44_21170, partial [Oricola sp.]|nr:hypothetical protein [Oricola sp.]
MKKEIAVAALCLTAANAQAADYAVVHAGKLLATPGEAVAQNKTVIIKDGWVERIADGFLSADAIGAGADDEVAVYDLKGMFVMPGLIDGHVHITGENNPNARLQTVQLSDADDAIAAA